MTKGTGVQDGTNRWSKGQSTVEYLLVLVALLSMVVSVAAVWKAGRSGALLDRAVAAASHQLSGRNPVGSAQDIALY